MPLSLRETLREILGPTVEGLGFDLVAVELLGGGRRPVLRVSIDGPKGVDASACARITHRINPLLDEADPLPGAYDLEVSSPGIDRPVQRLSDFARFVGYRVRLRLEEGLPRRRYTGRIRAVVAETIELDVDGTIFPIDFATVDAAYLVLDLEEYHKLGEGLPPLPTDGQQAPPSEPAETLGRTGDAP